MLKYPIRIDNYDKKNGNKHFVLGIESVLEFAEQLPTIDAVEVVHGYLIHGYCGEYDNFDNCSICGARNLEDSEYCCQCGAKMDGHKKDVM